MINTYNTSYNDSNNQLVILYYNSKTGKNKQNKPVF